MTALDTSTRNATLPGDETMNVIVQEGVKQKDLHEAVVTLLDGRRLTIHVHKNADGEVLFNLVTNYIGLIEKDYFSLAFYEHSNIRKWLYTKKKIAKQVKDLPWDFSLEVKFYVPDPRQLNEDFTRHLFTLQLRIDLYETRLPATFLNQAHLGSLIAQAELGDYKPECQYYEALKGLNIVRSMTPELADKIVHFYKDQKGKQPPEAELAFLLACREISMYGMAVFEAKEGKKPVRIGINSSGISVFQDQLRIHYVIWQSMHQLEFRSKTFTVKLKPGEKEGKTSLSFKLDDEPSAKRCWKTAVEHHTFFRLVQPDEKSRRSKFEGRTLFQSQMASQTFTSHGDYTMSRQEYGSLPKSQTGENVTSHSELQSVPFQKQQDENVAPLNTSARSATKSPHDTTQSTTNGTHEVGGQFSRSSAAQEHVALSLNTQSVKPLFVSTTLVTSDSTVSSRCYTVSESLSPQLIQQLSPQSQPRHELSVSPTNFQQNGYSASPSRFHSVPTLLSSAWFSLRQRTSTPKTPATKPEPDSAQFTTTKTSSAPRSTTASPYAQMIASGSDSSELLLPIVREMNQQTMTTLMTLPSRSHTVLAEYLSTADVSHLSPELISAYRNLLTASGNTPSQAEEKIRAAISTRVYCRRSPLSPPTLNTPLPPDVEDIIRTRSPSPTVRFDDTVNHCIRIKVVEVDNQTPVYLYNVSAAEAHRAATRGGYSPNRQGYVSLTREEANRQVVHDVQETPKRKFFGQRKRRQPQPFLRAENTPLYYLRKDRELEEAPIRFYSSIYHSGSSGRQIISRFRHIGEEEIREVRTDEYNYLNREKAHEPLRLEKQNELQPQNIRSAVRTTYSSQQKYHQKQRPFTPSQSGYSKTITKTTTTTTTSKRRSQTNGFNQIDEQPSSSYPQLTQPHEGQWELVVKSPDIDEKDELRSHVDVYHSGYSIVSRNRRYRFFTREKHPGQEEVVESAKYDLNLAPFEGVAQPLEREIEVETQPIKSTCKTYYKEQKVRRKKKAKKGEEASDEEESVSGSEESEETAEKQTARIHVRTEGEEPTKPEKIHKPLFKFGKKQEKTKKTQKSKLPQISEKYEGALEPLEHQKEFDGAKFEECVDVCVPSTSEQKVEQIEVVKKSSLQKSKLFGFLKEHEDTKTPLSQYPTTELYEGPLESTSKHDELDPSQLRRHVEVYHSGQSLQIRHRKYRFFTREKHEGEEEVVEKPEYTAIDSTPFEGTHEALSRDVDIDNQPIKSTCNIYHTGISYVKSKQKSKRKSETEDIESSSESEQEEHAKTKITTIQTTTTIEKSTSKMQKFFKRPSKQFPEIGEHFEATEFIHRDDDLLPSPLNDFVTISQPSTSYEIKEKPKISEIEAPSKMAKIYVKSYEDEFIDQEEPTKKKHKEKKPIFSALTKKSKPAKFELSSDPYTGELEAIKPDSEFDGGKFDEYVELPQPTTSGEQIELEIVVEDHKPKSTAKLFLKKKKERIVKSKLDDYPTATERFDATHITHRNNDVEPLPIHDFAEIYHPGTSHEIKLKEKPKISKIEEPIEESVEPKQMAKIYIKSYEDEFTEKEEPIEKKSKEKKATIFSTLTKRQKSDKFNLSTDPYTGPLEILTPEHDHQKSDLTDYVDVIYVQTPLDEKIPQIKILVEQATEEREDDGQPPAKQTAVLHMRSTENEPEEQQEEVHKKRNIFRFLRRGEKEAEKVKSPSTSSHPLPIIPDDTPIFSTDKDSELADIPLAESVNIREIEVQSPVKSEKYRIFHHRKSQNEEVLETKKKSEFPINEESFTGTLESVERTKDIDQYPILDYATLYHPGTSSPSKAKSKIPKSKKDHDEEELEKQTALIHTVTHEYETSVEETSKEGKSLFGYFKHRKSHVEESPYNFSTEEYTGPYISLNKTEFESDPLSKHVDVYYEGPDSADFQKAKSPEPTKVQKSDYPIDDVEYTGSLDLLTPDSNLEILQISSFVDINEENRQLVQQIFKTTRFKHHEKKEKVVKESPVEEEVTIEQPSKLTAHIHLKSDDEENEEPSTTTKPKSLFGFLRKTKKDELESPKSPDYPTTVLPADTILESINKDEELEPNPLELPSSTAETVRHKKYRLFIREKGSPSDETFYPKIGESYTGPIEYIEPESHLDLSPINQYVNVYYFEKLHSKRKLKIPKIKSHEKPPSEEKPVEESKVKKTAHIHLKEEGEPIEIEHKKSKFEFWRQHKENKEDQKPTNTLYGLSDEQFATNDELNKSHDFQPEPLEQHVDVKHPGFFSPLKSKQREEPALEKQTAVIHLRSIENIQTNLAEADTSDKTLFGFLRGRKTKSKHLQYYPQTEEIYTGPLNLIAKDEEFNEDPNIVLPTDVPYPESKIHEEVEEVSPDKKKAILHLKSGDEERAKPKSWTFLKRKQKENVGYPENIIYNGQLEDLNKEGEFVEDKENVITPTDVPYKGIESPSQTRKIKHLKLFLRSKHEGSEDVVDSNISNYQFDPTSFEGQLELLKNEDGFDSAPLTSVCEIKEVHPVEKSKLKLFKFSQKSEEKSEEPKSTAILHLKSAPEIEEKKQKRKQEKEEHKRYLSNALYGLSSESFPTNEELNKTNDINTELIEQHVNVKYPGFVVVSPKKSDEEIEKIEEIVKPKSTAIIHLKSTEFEEPIEQREHTKSPSFFAFLKQKDVEKPSDYPQNVYEGPVESIKKYEEFESDLNNIIKPSDVPYKIASPTQTRKGLKLFLKEESKKESFEPAEIKYPFDEKIYEGELDPLNHSELATSPIREHVQIFTEEKIEESEPKSWSLLIKRKSKDVEKPSDYPQNIVYEGEVENLIKNEEFESDLNVIKPSDVPYKIVSPTRQVKGLRLFLRTKHEGEEEILEADQSKYAFNPSKFEGIYDPLSHGELTTQPITDFVEMPKEEIITKKVEEESPIEIKSKKSWISMPKRKHKEVVGYPENVYEGPLEDLNKNEEFIEDKENLIKSADVPYQLPETSTRQVKGLKLFLRTKHEGQTEDIKSKYDPTPFEGEYQQISHDESSTQPITDFVEMPKEIPTTKEPSTEFKQQKSWISMPKRKQKEVVGYPQNVYEGPVESIKKDDEFVEDPNIILPADVPYTEPILPLKQTKGLRIFVREKLETKPSLYNFDTAPYTGDLETTVKNAELEDIPIKSICNLYDISSATKFTIPKVIIEEPSIVVESEEKPTKQVANIVVKSTEIEEPTTTKHKPLFGFLKKGEKKEKYSSYPTTLYDGTLESTSKDPELESDLLENHVDVYHFEEKSPIDKKTAHIHLRTVETSEIVESEQPKEKRRSLIEILRGKSSEREEISKSSSISSYPQTLPYDGPLEEVKYEEFEHDPNLILSSDVPYYDAASPTKHSKGLKLFVKGKDEDNKYVLSTDPFTGEYQQISHAEHQTQPITDFVELKTYEEKLVEESEEKRKSISWAFLKKHEDEPEFPINEEAYSGTLSILENDEFNKEPLDISINDVPYYDAASPTKHSKGLKLFVKGKDEDNKYVLSTDPFTGECQQISHAEHQTQPITDFVELKTYEERLLEESEEKRKSISWAFLTKHKDGFPTNEEIYTGTLSTLNNDEFNKEPLDISINDVPYYDAASPTKHSKGLKLFMKHEKVEAEKPPNDFPTNEEVYTGTLSTLNNEEFNKEPLNISINDVPYYDAAKQPKVKTYILDTSKYEGPLNELSHQHDLTSEPLLEHVALVTKPEEKSEIVEEKVAIQTKRKQKVGFPTDEEPYSGSYELLEKNDEFVEDPNLIEPTAPIAIIHHKGLRIFLRHDEKSAFALDTTPFTGELFSLAHNEIETVSIKDHVDSAPELLVKEVKPKTEEVTKAELRPKKSWISISRRKQKQLVGYPENILYDGKLEDLNKDDEFVEDKENVIKPSEVPYQLPETSTQTRQVKGLRLFLRTKHEGEEETSDADKSKYAFDSSKFEGSYDPLLHQEIATQPITDFVEMPKEIPTTTTEEPSTEVKEKKSWISMPKRKYKEFIGYPQNVYEGPLEDLNKNEEFIEDKENLIKSADVPYQLPETSTRQVKGLRLFLRTKHEGEEETSDADKSKYSFDPSKFEGEYDPLLHQEISTQPITDFVEMPKEEAVVTTKAIITTKEPTTIEVKEKKSWISMPKRKHKEVIGYPQNVYEGPVESINKDDEFESDPNNLIKPSEVPYQLPETSTRQVKGLKLFLRSKDEGQTEDIKPKHDYDPTPFTGDYQQTIHSEFEPSSISEHVELKVYEEKTPEIPTKVEEISEEPKTFKGIHIFTQKPRASYQFDPSKFEGIYDPLSHGELTTQPITDFVEMPKEEIITKKVEEESPIEIKSKKSWISMPKRKHKEFIGYPQNVYEGPVENLVKNEEFIEDKENLIKSADVPYQLPETSTRQVKGLKLFLRTKHEGQTEDIKSKYVLSTDPFTGEYQQISHAEHQTQPITDFVELKTYEIPKVPTKIEEILIQKQEISEEPKTSKGLHIFTQKSRPSYQFDSTPFTGDYQQTIHSEFEPSSISEHVELKSYEVPEIPTKVEEIIEEPSPKRSKALKIFTQKSKPFYQFDPTPFEGEYQQTIHSEFEPSSISEHIELKSYEVPEIPTKVEEISEEPKTSKGLHIFTKKSTLDYVFDPASYAENHPPLVHSELQQNPIKDLVNIYYIEELPQKQAKVAQKKQKLTYNFNTDPYTGDYEKISHSELQQNPIKDFVNIYHIEELPQKQVIVEEPPTPKQTALIYVKSQEEIETPTKPAKRAFWSAFRKRRREGEPSDLLETVAFARKGDDFELVGGMAIGNAALFKSGEPVTDLDMQLFLRKHQTAEYHIEVLLRDTRTTEFPVLFDGRRGPKFLPRSLLESSIDEASLTLNEPRNKRRKPDLDHLAPPGESPEEGEEADASSLASQEHEEKPKRHKLHHHRHETETLPESSKKGSMLATFRQQLLQIGKKSPSKSPSKDEIKRKISSSSSSDDSQEVEIEERHRVLVNEHDSSKRPERQGESSSPDKMFKTIRNLTNESAGPYTSPKNENGAVIRNEKVETVYRLKGAGEIPTLDPTDPSLINIYTKCIEENSEVPNIEMFKRDLKIEETAQSPKLIKEGFVSCVFGRKAETGKPRSTLQTWHETTVGPEQVTTEVDEFGNLIKKTIKTEQVKKTIQKQTYQTYTVDSSDNKALESQQEPSDLKHTLDSIQTISSSIPTNLPTGHAHTHVLVYGRDGELREPLETEKFDENQIVSSKVITTGNRTIETITYKTIKDGVVHTNVEHRVTITGPEVDQDAELRRAIAEATGLNPKYEVQRIEIKEERLQ